MSKAKEPPGVLFRYVKQQLARLGIDQADLAAASGIDPGHLSRYLRGKHEIPPTRLTTIASVLKVREATLRAMADLDQLGSERARELSRHLVSSDPAAPPGPADPGPLTPEEVGKLAAAFLSGDPDERQRLLKSLPSRTLAQVRAAVLGDPQVGAS